MREMRGKKTYLLKSFSKFFITRDVSTTGLNSFSSLGFFDFGIGIIVKFGTHLEEFSEDLTKLVSTVAKVRPQMADGLT